LVAYKGNAELVAVALVAKSGNAELAAVAFVQTALPPVTLTATRVLVKKSGSAEQVAVTPVTTAAIAPAAFVQAAPVES
jgi:hypothetical protein